MSNVKISNLSTLLREISCQLLLFFPEVKNENYSTGIIPLEDRDIEVVEYALSKFCYYGGLI